MMYVFLIILIIIVAALFWWSNKESQAQAEWLDQKMRDVTRRRAQIEARKKTDRENKANQD